MTNCTYCNSFILFGGTKAGQSTFCNAKCLQGARYLAIAQQIPESTILETIDHLNLSGCPQCKGPGPIDVHTSHMVWSALILTSWSSKPKVSCRSCGIKSQLSGAGASMFVGWWGFPWGLIMTPVQIGRNVVAMASKPQHPTAHLKRIVGLNIAAQMVAQQQQSTPLPPIPTAVSQ